MSINYEKYNWARLLPITEIAYNNVKIANVGHTLFELNDAFYLRAFYKEYPKKPTATTLTDSDPLIPGATIKFFLANYIDFLA